MSEFYEESHRALQDEFGTRKLADRLVDMMSEEIVDDAKAFIESRDLFFLTTVSAAGEPTVSHKGGGVGFVKVLDPKTIVFPSYDGNGMYLSMGNIAATAKIGMLFIAFDTPHRIRVQATAAVAADDAAIDLFPGADLVVRATVDHAFINCPRYIHKRPTAEQSRYVPDADGQAPLAGWKQLDVMQDVLPAADVARVAAEGGPITFDEYGARAAQGNA